MISEEPSTSPLLVSILPPLGAGLLAAALAAWVVVRRPAWAERASRALVDPRCLAAAGLLAAVAWGAAPAGSRPAIGWAIAGVGLVAVPLIVGLLLFPSETRGGRPVAPAPAPATESTLLERLRAPWDSATDARPPAVIDLARAALAAYGPPRSWEATVPRLGFDGHVPLVAGAAQGVVMTLGDEAVVAFRGTDDFADWFTNLDVALDAAGEVHRGFAAAYASLQDQLRRALRHRGVRQVWITGHSLGGAMAVIAALDLILGGGVRVRGVMTFGQPLLLAPSFAPEANRLLAGRFLRFIHGDDVVPRVIPGLRGGGNSLWFRDGGTLFFPPRSVVRSTRGEASPRADDEGGPTPLTEREFAEEQASLRGASESVEARMLPTAADHPMTRYLDAVERHFGAGGGRR